MFGFNKKESLQRDTEILEQIEKLWLCHNNLSELVKNLTDLLRQITEGVAANREDFEYLAQETMKIAEQQNKMMAHILRNEGIIMDTMESKSLH